MSWIASVPDFLTMPTSSLSSPIFIGRRLTVAGRRAIPNYEYQTLGGKRPEGVGKSHLMASS